FTLQAIPELQSIIPQIEEKHGIKLQIMAVEMSVEEALEALPPDTQAVLVTHLLRISPHDFHMLVGRLVERRLPSFSWWGWQEVEMGILAGIAPESTMEHLARSVAVNVQDILRGEDAGTLPAAFTLSEQLTINMATARAIDIYPSLSMLTEADLLNEQQQDVERMLTLEKVVQEALTANLDLAAADRNVAAGAQEVLQSRSELLPQIGIATGGTVIDEDRARASGGVQPERSWTGSAGATQLIYSDKAWSGYTVQKHLQDSRVEGREAVRLDIVQAAATEYLNVLRAKTIERIQKDNLKLTRANLERANVRVSVGIAGPDEIYRWESEIAQRRQIVLSVESLTLDTMNALNRILNRPLQEQFVVEDTEMSDPLFTFSDKLFMNLVTNPRNLQLFRSFMVQEGLELAPELRRFNAEIAARERTLVTAKREFWLPTFSLEGNVTEYFAEEGAGTRDAALTGIDTTDWAVGVYATLPLFTGGGKRATKKRTVEELAQLRIERNAVAERIEQRILNAINQTRASYPSIELSRDGADAANNNLKLVTDSYARGIKSIIDLLDAQNLALEADQRAANSVHNFLIDLVSVQRAVGKFGFFLSEADREAWVEKMKTFFEKEGAHVGTP
ncbi:MAG: TolC family protein, partial [Deltaproteobacteria bacterium]|nr:TolC family protein [Deltaproteobacteria bacterium]